LPRSVPRYSALILSIFLVLGGAASAATGGSETKPRKWVRGIYVAETPLAETLPRSLAWSRANNMAQQHGGIALEGQGGSMEPLYAPGTILVVAPADFETLARGQTVVYLSKRRTQVAHVLVAKCPDGWRVAGLGNRTYDDEGVREDNLMGVVVAAYAPVEDRIVALNR